MDKLTVIDGGKTSTPGATHTHETHAAPAGATPVSKVCKSGLLIRFDGTMFEHLPGVALSGPEYAEGDLRLIAAAPDLLAALSAIIAAEAMPVDLKDPKSNGAYFAAYAEALSQAREAIAKAEGIA